MTAPVDHASLYRLMSWLSPSFPVGAFSYSHGLEFAVETGLVSDRDSLVDWIATLLRHGSGMSDGILFGTAWDACAAENAGMIADLLERSAALRPTAELALETSAQGDAFLRAVRAAWPHRVLDNVAEIIAEQGLTASYPILVAVAAHAHGIDRQEALNAYLHAFAANLISAAVRLVPLGQTDGQVALRALEKHVGAAAAQAERRGLDRIGSAVPMVEWCSANHETQYTRLFRS